MGCIGQDDRQRGNRDGETQQQFVAVLTPPTAKENRSNGNRAEQEDEREYAPEWKGHASRSAFATVLPSQEEDQIGFRNDVVTAGLFDEHRRNLSMHPLGEFRQ